MADGPVGIAPMPEHMVKNEEYIDLFGSIPDTVKEAQRMSKRCSEGWEYAKSLGDQPQPFCEGCYKRDYQALLDSHRAMLSRGVKRGFEEPNPKEYAGRDKFVRDPMVPNAKEEALYKKGVLKQMYHFVCRNTASEGRGSQHRVAVEVLSPLKLEANQWSKASELLK